MMSEDYQRDIGLYQGYHARSSPKKAVEERDEGDGVRMIVLVPVDEDSRIQGLCGHSGWKGCPYNM